ncbi:serine O-acetyltransferase [Pseudarthrobacter sp. L1SW]|uniref:serine O-acetyltransferase n=1 Tax=Pseudarthrobacter sp. L1SW TaxID=2851598 RepID=UPI00351D942E|nr:serine acetyltransferase [Pseudarthrobacter sp. L1SW]
MAFIDTLRADARRLHASSTSLTSLVKLFVTNSSFAAATVFRLSSALRDSSPGTARLLAKANLILHGIDIDYRARIGPGILFAHPVGTVIGGDCRIGANATLMSAVVLGRRDVLGGPDKGMYPTIGDDVTLGTGASVLGPVTVGAGSLVAAHALLLESIECDSLAVGMPAKARPAKVNTQQNVSTHHSSDGSN